MKKIFAFFILTFAVSGAGLQAQEVQKKTLPNGLTVLVQENHSAPVVSVRFYVRTGSIYEEEHLGAGLSHLFEHTLFEGTKTRDKKALSDELQAIGGQSNAYTSYDVTCYHVTTAAPYFSRALGVLTDMMRNATFPQKEVETQQGVIHNEMNIGEDDPQDQLGELFNSTAFRVHPVRYPIIGYRSQFDKLTREEILSYYKAHYTPENTILSVAGDVSANSVFEAADKQLGDWERGAAHTPALASEPLQNSPRRAVLQKDVNQTYLMMGWHSIPLQNPDLYALDTLAQILGGGESSRLVRVLRDQKNLVNSIDAYSSTPNYDAGVFAVTAVLDPDKQKEVEAEVRRQIGAIKAAEVTPEELQRAQRQIRASFTFNKEGVEEQAETAAYDELGTGDPNFSKRYVTKIGAVTPAQILEVARKYLRDESLTVAAVVPRTKVAKTDEGVGTLGGEAVANPDGEETTTEPATAPEPVKAAPPAAPRLIVLPNGARLLIRPSKSAPTVSIVAMGLGGVRLEDAKEAGVADLTASLLTRGTATRTADQISDTVDGLGGSMEGFSGYNSYGIESQWLATDWQKGLNLVAESFLAPSFPENEVANFRTQTLSALASQDDDPMTASSLLMRRLYFGKHPLSRSPLGTVETVKALNRAKIEQFWKQTTQPDSTVIAIYGDVDPAAVEKTAAFLFGRFKAQAPALKAPEAVNPPPTFTSRLVEKPGITQSVLWFAFPSIAVKNDDRWAIDVLDAALSGADLPGGRLHERLRDNQLVYVVHAFDSPALDGGIFIIYAGTTRENRAQVKTIIDEEVNKIRDVQISPQELERAKSMAISAHAISLQSNGSLARQAASDELFGLGANDSAQYAARINAVTLADVQRMAQKYLDKSHGALAIVEPPKGAAQKVAPEKTTPEPEKVNPGPTLPEPATPTETTPEELAPETATPETETPETPDPETANPEVPATDQ